MTGHRHLLDSLVGGAGDDVNGTELQDHLTERHLVRLEGPPTWILELDEDGHPQWRRGEARTLVDADGHHAHEVAGRAIRDAVECGGSGERRVMFWGLWADLPFPNVLVRFGAERLAEIQAALAAHEGELARSRFDRLLAGRAAANAVLGPERAFGFGADGLEAGGRSGVGECAELLCEVGWSAASGWRLAPPRMFDTSDVEEPGRAPTGPELGWWLHATSARDQLRRA